MLFSVSARLVMRIPFEGADLIARRILTASLVDRRVAAVDVIKLSVSEFTKFVFVTHTVSPFCRYGMPVFRRDLV
jgi:hypothetical protein